MPSDSLNGGREKVEFFFLRSFVSRKLAIYDFSLMSVPVVCFFYDPSIRRSTHLGSFAVMHFGCHSVSDAVRPASLSSGPRRSRTKFLPQPAPDLRLLPSGIQRSPIRCEFSAIFPNFFFGRCFVWFRHQRSRVKENNKSLPAGFFWNWLFLHISHIITVSNASKASPTERNKNPSNSEFLNFPRNV